jgi:SAM-dependent methyltransferase
MFVKSARFYDAIYSWKDYAEEARQVHVLIEGHKRSPGVALLDVACGTGAHIAHLRGHYMVEGMDLDEGMVAIARERHPDITFHHGDMLDFDPGRQYDVVTCLFSSVGYVKTIPRLQQAVHNLGKHVVLGGLVIVEAWIYPKDFREGYISAQFVDEPELKIARMTIGEVKSGVSGFDFHYLVATSEGVEHFVERHELGLFEHEDYLAAFDAAGLTIVHYDAVGLSGRGLYVGRREQTLP